MSNELLTETVKALLADRLQHTSTLDAQSLAKFQLLQRQIEDEETDGEDQSTHDAGASIATETLLPGQTPEEPAGENLSGPGETPAQENSNG